MYNLIECSDNYSKTYGSLWQCYRNETFLNNNGAIANFPDIADNNNSAPFKFKTKIADRIGNYSIKVVKIMVPLKYLSNFWRTLEMSLINCEVNLELTWSKDCVITNSTGEGKFKITDTKLYVPVVTLSTQDNAKLLQQLKSDFKQELAGINVN